jgi:glycosyltransferase involved in cell wall biosynthesis
MASVDGAVDIVHVHSHRLKPEWVFQLRELLPRSTFVEQSIWSTRSPFTGCMDLIAHQSPWMAWKYLCQTGRRVGRPGSIVAGKPIDLSVFRAGEHERSRFGAAARGRLGIPAGALVVGRVGQPGEGKWHEVLVRAFASLADALPSLHLLTVGAPDSIREAVTSLPETQRDRVVMIERLHDDTALRDVYCAMDVYAHAARLGETFGQSIVEAMAAGTPIVTLHTPYAGNAQSEMVLQAGAGFVADSGDLFRRRLEMLLKTEPLREAVGERARAGSLLWDQQRVCGHFLDLVAHVRSGAVGKERRSGLSRRVLSLDSAIASRGLRSRTRRTLIRLRPLVGWSGKGDYVWRIATERLSAAWVR